MEMHFRIESKGLSEQAVLRKNTGCFKDTGWISRGISIGIMDRKKEGLQK